MRRGILGTVDERRATTLQDGCGNVCTRLPEQRERAEIGHVHDKDHVAQVLAQQRRVRRQRQRGRCVHAQVKHILGPLDQRGTHVAQREVSRTQQQHAARPVRAGGIARRRWRIRTAPEVLRERSPPRFLVGSAQLHFLEGPLFVSHV